jgi:hypothetical protein
MVNRGPISSVDGATIDQGRGQLSLSAAASHPSYILISQVDQPEDDRKDSVTKTPVLGGSRHTILPSVPDRGL